ncbi:D-alanyl-D-alanine carboxypeptidase, partial [Streptomyces griseoloalbus]
MAGESPDRSKQRESSAEPTSGSAGPVPEKRDPRLAVAREESSPQSRGSVDTATRVLSAREATENTAEAEDGPSAERDDSAAVGEGRLSEAVATWVRSADSVEPAEDGARAAEAEDASAEGGRPKTDDERTAAAEGATKTEDAADEDGTGDEGAPSADAQQAAPDT